ncbi:MAG: GlxA family transcriptional regulator [Actinomycetes bacterium]
MVACERVAMLAYRGAVAFDLVTVSEVFGADHAPQSGGWYDTRVCAAQPGPVPLGAGLTVTATHDLDAVADSGLVVVPGWADETSQPPRRLLQALRAAYAAGSRIMSVCTGAFVLGHAGLLDGRRATTHWSSTAQLARMFPDALVEPSALFVDDGQILTSAGMTAGIDLALHVVRTDFGPHVAAALARRLVVSAYRAGGQGHVVDVVALPDAEDPLPSLLDWMRAHLCEPQPLTMLAARVHMSPRTLTRRFLAVTGTTPHQWLIRERLLAVQRLLEVSNEPIERIARRTGFPSSTNMRQLFRRHVGIAPQSYRTAHRSRDPYAC